MEPSMKRSVYKVLKNNLTVIYWLKIINNLKMGNDIKKNESNPRDRIMSTISVKHIVVDCSPVNFIDSMGANSILQVTHS